MARRDAFQNGQFCHRRQLVRGAAGLLMATTVGALSPARAISIPATGNNRYLTGNRLRLISTESVPLKSFRDPDGTASGISVDLAMEAARRAGYEPEIDLMPWNRVLIEGKQRAGVIAAIFRTPARELDYFFTDELYMDEVVVVVPHGKAFDFTQPADLIGRRVAAQKGAVYGPDFAEVTTRIQFEEDNDPAQRLRKLTLRQLDAALFNPGPASVRHAAMAAGIDPSQFEILPVPLARSPSHMALGRPPRGGTSADDAIIQQLNVAISSLKTDGTVTRMMAKYLS